MKYPVKISHQADTDLRGIFEYIAYTLQSYENALGQLERLEKQISSLSTLPYRFRLYESDQWRSMGLRIMPVDHYLVFYVPVETPPSVTILRIFYGGQDVIPTKRLEQRN